MIELILGVTALVFFGVTILVLGWKVSDIDLRIKALEKNNENTK